MVSLPARASRRLRCGRVGCGAPLFQRKNWHDGRLLRRRDADAGGDRSTSASGSDRTEHDGKQLSRWLDLSVRGIRAMVRSELDYPTRTEHARALYSSEYKCASRSADAAAHELSGFQFRAVTRRRTAHTNDRA